MRKNVLFLISVALLIFTLTDLKGSNALDYLRSNTLAVTSEPALPGTPTIVVKCTNYVVTYPGPFETGVTYFWHTSSGSTDMTHPISSTVSITATPGTYYIRGYNSTAIPAEMWGYEKTVTLGAIVPPTLDVTATKAAVCVGGVSTLKATGECTSFHWDQNITSTTANVDVSPIVTTTYMVTGVDDNFCTNSKSIEVVVNVITPPTIAANSSGTNPIIDVMCKGKNQTIYAVDPGTNHITWFNNKTSVATDVPSYTLTNISGDVNLKVRYQNPTNDCYSDTTSALIKMMTVDFTLTQTTVSLGGQLLVTNKSTNALSYEWTLMNGLVKEEGPFANPSFHYNILGTKSIKLVASTATCKDSISKSFIVSGITNLKSKADNILVYPNPFKNLINVDLSGRNKDVSVEIYNLSGVKVMDKEIKKANDIEAIDMTELPAGMYLMILTTDKTILTAKLKKE